MCGIAGFYFPKINAESSRDLIGRMTDALVHRGPDSSGTYLSRDNRLALGHRRLSIIELSDSGAQPMSAADGQTTIIFNGEIYNFRDLRKDLEKSGFAFRGNSDTEVLLNLIVRDGLTKAIRSCVGMFAAAIWNEREQTLSLVRDRLGEKPLYVGFEADGFWFASELKARTAIGFDKPELNKSAVNDYFEFGYIPDPETIYEDVYSLPAASIVEMNLQQQRANFRQVFIDQLDSARYWRPDERSIRDRTEGAQQDGAQKSVEKLERALKKSIADELVADVPVGCFLSGGIDSSLVVALAQEQSGSQVETFTISFEDPSFNEAEFAQDVADHLGTRHHCRPCRGKDALRQFDELSSVFDQPFANASALPSLLLAEYASEHVKVCLTGDGADEVFAGYNRYLLPPSVARLRKSWHYPLVKTALSAALKLGSGRWDSVGRLFSGLSGTIQNLEAKLQKLDDSLSCDNEFEMFDRLIRYFGANESLLIEEQSAKARPSRTLDRKHDFLDSARFFDVKNYLPGDNLTKVDRTAMQSSLETRAPFLDHRIVELGLQMKGDQLVRGRKGKLPLRTILSKYLPDRMIDRPKMGFSVPVAEWLGGDLKHMLAESSSQSHLVEQGLFCSNAVATLLQAHKQEETSSASRLWAFLVFQRWHQDAYASGSECSSLTRFVS